jgi:DNA-binding ferritin-like protein (Dps family)
MSQVRKVKGVSPNYMQFLWLSIGKIRAIHSEGDWATALNLAVSLIDYLPDEFKDEFGKEVDKVLYNIGLITDYRLTALQNIEDMFQRQFLMKKILANYSKAALSRFIKNLSKKLDEKGYYEIKTHVPEGFSHTLDFDV